MASFFETLNYSSCNEDSSSELAALQISKDDRVLCITGSGARTLDLLTERPRRVVSIDCNPCQSFLLELKIAGIKRLRYEEYLEFLGVLSSSGRRSSYKDIRHMLSDGARGFWDRNPAMIEKGVIYQGRWERYFRRLARLVSLVRPRLVRKLFRCACLDEQTRVWREDWDGALWRIFLRLVSMNGMWKHALADPGFYRCVLENFSVSTYLNERFASAFESFLAHESPFATLLFFGRYDARGVLPIHLQTKYYETLQCSLSSVQIVTESLAQYLERCEGEQYDKYSLSDIASYTDAKDYGRIWRGIIATAPSGARFCERQFLAKRHPPSDVERLIRRDQALEARLAKTDTSMFYTFVVGEIIGLGDD